MVKQITQKLTANPSYLKWGNERLADYFGCAPSTIAKIKTSLTTVKRNYIASLA